MSTVDQNGKRAKTGGRTAGTPNKATKDIQERLDELGCDPIEGMATIAMDTKNPPELRGRMYSELAGYIAPKRKAVEVHAGGTVNIEGGGVAALLAAAQAGGILEHDGAD